MKKSHSTPAREWVPSSFLIVHDENISTTIRFSPMQIQRADVSYTSKIFVYHRSIAEPIWKAESGTMGLEDVFSIDSAQIARESKMDRLFAYGEAYNVTPDMAPPTANTAMPVHVHYTSRDGSMFGHLASFFIFGSPRSLQRGERYYENFPAARIDANHLLQTYTINPFARACRFTVRIMDGRSISWESQPIIVRGKGVAQWSSVESGCPQFDHPVGIVIASDLKTSSFFGTRHADGRMVGLDHGHPFLAQVLNHGMHVAIPATGGVR